MLAELDDWLPPLVAGRRGLRDIDPAGLSDMLDSRLGWEGRKAVDRLAPHRFDTAAGSSHAIDYEAEAGPTVTVRVQALYGLSSHPAIAGGRVPLVLSLTSPAGRPIQTTRDLPGFWKRQLGGGREGDARPLSQASLAGRSGRRGRDAEDQESLAPPMTKS